MFLGDNSGLDNNNFEYLLVLKYFFFQPKTPKTQVEDEIFEESDIKRVILYLDLWQESLPDLFHAGITIISNDPLDTVLANKFP
jgi:hypothetical protein